MPGLPPTPPAKNPAPEVAPPPDPCLLESFKSLPSLQVVPFHSSASLLLFGGIYPPAYIAVEELPKPTPVFLPVFNSAISVQLLPLYV